MEQQLAMLNNPPTDDKKKSVHFKVPPRKKPTEGVKEETGVGKDKDTAAEKEKGSAPAVEPVAVVP